MFNEIEGGFYGIEIISTDGGKNIYQLIFSWN